MRVIAVLIFLVSFVKYTYSQSGKSSFYPEGYGKLFNREHVYFVAITTQNKTDSFFYALQKQLGKSTYVQGYTVYTFSKPQWSKERVEVSIQHVLQTDSDKSTSNTLFIYVGTKSGVDLLKPLSKSRTAITDFFKNIYQQKIVHREHDDFR